MGLSCGLCNNAINTFLLFPEWTFRQLAFLVGHEVRSLCKDQIVNVDNVHRFQCLSEVTAHYTATVNHWKQELDDSCMTDTYCSTEVCDENIQPDLKEYGRIKQTFGWSRSVKQPLETAVWLQYLQMPKIIRSISIKCNTNHHHHCHYLASFSLSGHFLVDTPWQARCLVLRGWEYLQPLPLQVIYMQDVNKQQHKRKYNTVKLLCPHAIKWGIDHSPLSVCQSLRHIYRVVIIYYWV